MEDEGAEILRRALQDDNMQIARCAAHALAELGDTSGIGLVIDTFRDDSWSILCTPSTLAKSGHKRAVEALMEYIESFLDMESLPPGSAMVVKALGKSADERATDMLETVMYKNHGRKLRRAAVMALQEIGTEKAVNALLEALISEDGSLWQHARNALIKTGPEILPKLQELVEQTKDNPRRTVASLIQTIM